ncbi:hypothetical protein PR048_008501 [Dryococelus australis]|uniref:Uncharacterized protein n=1 Tax=Dryococelus australis TaxID=614101 RepID=A0ABQ9HXA2_9NEOP|nr:hypothetical protein PR048_008501 [Dryococelus australis]
MIRLQFLEAVAKIRRGNVGRLGRLTFAAPGVCLTSSTPHVRWADLLVCKYGRRGAGAAHENMTAFPSLVRHLDHLAPIASCRYARYGSIGVTHLDPPPTPDPLAAFGDLARVTTPPLPAGEADEIKVCARIFGNKDLGATRQLEKFLGEGQRPCKYCSGLRFGSLFVEAIWLSAGAKLYAARRRREIARRRRTRCSWSEWTRERADSTDGVGTLVASGAILLECGAGVRAISGDRGRIVVRLLVFHQDEPGSIPGGVTPEFSHVGIVLDDSAGQRVFSRSSRLPHPFIPALLHTHLASHSPAHKTLSVSKKTRRPTASSSTIPTCENPVTRPGIEPGSPWWESEEIVAPYRLHRSEQFGAKFLHPLRCRWREPCENRTQTQSVLSAVVKSGIVLNRVGLQEPRQQIAILMFRMFTHKFTLC